MNYFKFIIILLILNSCVEVEFNQPMPPNKGNTLEKLPKEIVTYFMNLEQDSTGKKFNLNEVNSNFDWDDPLPSEVVLKKWKGDYFLNQREGNSWLLILVKSVSNKNFEVYHIDGNNEATINKLKSLTKAKETFDKDGDLDRILLDPSPKEFKKILKSGVFEKVDLFED